MIAPVGARARPSGRHSSTGIRKGRAPAAMAPTWAAPATVSGRR